MSVSAPAPLETLTIRADGLRRRNGSVAWMTRHAPRTFVS
jgi:hypothetical protein